MYREREARRRRERSRRGGRRKKDKIMIAKLLLRAYHKHFKHLIKSQSFWISKEKTKIE